MSTAPNDPDHDFLQASILYRDGHLQQAGLIFQRLSAQQPQRADLLTRWGACLVRQGKIAEAAPVLTRAGAVDPEQNGLYKMLGICFQSHGRYRQAVDCFERGSTIDPPNVETFFRLGDALVNLGQFRQAYEAYSQAAKLNPSLLVARQRQNICVERTGWQLDHEHFAAQAKKGGIDLLFLGDSFTAGWGGLGQGAGASIFEQEFASLKAANFGIDGDRTEHVLLRLQNGELDGIRPRVVMLLIGTNNCGPDDTPKTIAAGVEAIVREIHRRSPATRVLLLAILPRAEQPLREKSQAASELFAKLDDGGKTVKYLDIGNKFLTPDGAIAHEFMPDNLHLSALGYRIWADAVKEPIKELLKSPCSRALDERHYGLYSILYRALGMNLQIRGQHEDAIACYRRALTVDPPNAETHLAYYCLGEAMEKLGQFHQAIEAYRMAAELHPSYLMAIQRHNECVQRAFWQQAQHEAFVAQARKGGIDLLFLGDSITAGWGGPSQSPDEAGAPIFEMEFLPLKAGNFGVGSERTEHVLWRVQNGELDGIQPKVIMLLIGTNNCSPDDTPQTIASGVEAIVRAIHQRLPATKVLLLAIFPRGEQPLREKHQGANELFAKLDDDGKTVKYLDIGNKFLMPDGAISQELMPDSLHLSALGYRIWADAVKEPIRELLGS